MKKTLKKITDLTINDLLNNEVILPSIYFEKFNSNAKSIEIDLEDKAFEKEISSLIVEEYNTIESYMDSITQNVSLLSDCSKKAKNAILEKNIDALTDIYKKMNSLEKELGSLNKKLYADEITNSYNRKWIYSKFLNKESEFKDTGIVVLIDIVDYDYIKEAYKELIANNLLIFSTNFINKNLKEEKFDFKIARFFENKFLIFIENESRESINTTILNIQQKLLNTTLKSNSGLLIKANYNFSIENYTKGQDSKIVFESLFN